MPDQFGDREPAPLVHCEGSRRDQLGRARLHHVPKAEPAFRFYILYDKICREDVLLHAYALARANAGAPGVDGTTFAQIDASGVEAWLVGLREELVSKTYRADPERRATASRPIR